MERFQRMQINVSAFFLRFFFLILSFDVACAYLYQFFLLKNNLVRELSAKLIIIEVNFASSILEVSCCLVTLSPSKIALAVLEWPNIISLDVCSIHRN